MAEVSIPVAASRRTASYRCRDVDGDRHPHPVWRGHTALLLLRQCAVDGPFGTELTGWLHPWPEAEPLPAFTAPLIGWLTRTKHSDAARGRSFRSTADADD